MNRIFILMILVVLCGKAYGQSPGVVVYTGLTSLYSDDRNVTRKGEMHYGWLVGADARLVEGSLYFLVGGQYIITSLQSTSKASFFKNNDWTVFSGRFGLGFDLFYLKNGGAIRSKILGSINFSSKSPEGGLNIDGYRELNNSYMGIVTGLGYTWGVLDFDLEYQYGIFNAFYEQPDTKLDGFTLMFGLHF